MFEVQSVIEILSKTEEFFRRHGVPSPKLDAQLLLAHALGCKRLELFLRYDEPVVGEALEKCATLRGGAAGASPFNI